MLKSAHLTGPVSPQAGGLFDAVSRLVVLQHHQGVDVKVFGLWDELTEKNLAAWDPVPVTACKASWPKTFGHSPAFAAGLQTFQPDICHTHGLWLYPSIATRNYCQQEHRPYLISPHGMLDPWALKNSRWKKFLAYQLFEHEHLRGARCLRALCQSEAQSIRHLNLGNDIAVIPNGIDLPAASSVVAPPWHDYIRPEVKILLFLSRIHPKKGLVNLLQAWARQRSAGGQSPSSDWVLAIAGWDQNGHEAELKRLADELGLAWKDIRDDNGHSSPAVAHVRLDAGTQSGKPASHSPDVLFLGPRFDDAKAACYQHCEAFVLPSFSEGLPMVVLEAWARSKPVIMTPECNLPEGLLADAAIEAPATEDGLFSGLSQLFRMTGAERQAMGLRGQMLVAKRFSWNRVAEQMQSVYLWILGGGSKPDCVFAG